MKGANVPASVVRQLHPAFASDVRRAAYRFKHGSGQVTNPDQGASESLSLLHDSPYSSVNITNVSMIESHPIRRTDMLQTKRKGTFSSSYTSDVVARTRPSTPIAPSMSPLTPQSRISVMSVHDRPTSAADPEQEFAEALRLIEDLQLAECDIQNIKNKLKDTQEQQQTRLTTINASVRDEMLRHWAAKGALSDQQDLERKKLEEKHKQEIREQKEQHEHERREQKEKQDEEANRAYQHLASIRAQYSQAEQSLQHEYEMKMQAKAQLEGRIEQKKPGIPVAVVWPFIYATVGANMAKRRRLNGDCDGLEN